MISVSSAPSFTLLEHQSPASCQSSSGDTAARCLQVCYIRRQTRVLRATTSAAQYLLTDDRFFSRTTRLSPSRKCFKTTRNHFAVTAQNPTHIMSTAIAMAPSPAPHDRNAYVDIAPSNSSPRETRISAPSASSHHAPRSESTSPRGSSGSKGSPTR